MTGSTPELTPDGPNADQARFWQSASGRKWVEHQAALDALMAPVNRLLLERAAPGEGEAVLDVGCGTGATSLLVAERVGDRGRVVGIDIAPEMLRHAAARAPESFRNRLNFVEADAQTHDFGGDSFDLLVSRFGVMFFEEPAAAFRNLRQALCPGARMHFAAWGPMERNPWFAIPRAAAVARLGEPPTVPPRAPGPMAFAEMDYVQGILTAAGFDQARADVIGLELEPPGDVASVAAFAATVGPAARIIAHFEGSDEDAEAVRQAVASGLAPFERGGKVRIPAEVNYYSAVTP